MESQFGLYPQFYVKRKDLLFPLMEKYLGISMKGKTHGDAIGLYLRLLKTNEAFRGEVDNVITSNAFKNAIDPVTAGMELIGSIFNKKTADSNADAQFYDVVLAAQQQNDSSKILIISVVTLLVVAAGIFVFVKMKK